MIRELRIWLRRRDLEVPLPVAAPLVVIAGIAALVLLLVDWSTAGLPPKGAPGRYDWATAKYYKDYRTKLDAQKDRWFREHPQYQKYRGLPAEEMFLRIQQDEREQAEREAQRGKD
jgi:hypothetical protein